jgi:predicted nucleic acid-binding protein
MNLPPVNAAIPGVVIDTNVALDLLVFNEPRVQPLRAALADAHLCWLACARMGDELAEVLRRGLAAQRGVDATAVSAHWHACVTLKAAPTVGWRLRCTDDDDQVFIDLALEQRARWLLSRDRAVLKLARRAKALGLAIVTPETWAEQA